MKSCADILYVDLASTTLDTSASFSLMRFVQVNFRPPASELPHRHNFQEMFIVQSGHGRHAIDGEAIALQPSSVSLISKGQVHIVEHLTDFTGWIIRFSDDFLPAGIAAQPWPDPTILFNQLSRSHTLTIPPVDLLDLSSVLDLIEYEWTLPDTGERQNLLRHLLAVLIMRLERIYQNVPATTQHEREAYRIYQQFMALLEDQFARHHDVQHYASALQLPPIRLSRVLGRIIGKSTKQVIDERIVLEAKSYLHYTDLSITEIAMTLGYSDLFHLSKTFKRLTGIAPQAFREQRQKVT